MSTSLTGRQIANSYKELLKVAVSTNVGVSAALKTVQTGDAANSPLQLSQSTLNVNGTFALNGTNITVTGEQINAAVSGGFQNVSASTGFFTAEVCANTYYGDGSNLSGVTTSVATVATNVSGGYGVLTSLTAVDIRGATGGFTTKVSAAALEISGATSLATAVFSGQVSGVGAAFSSDVSVGTSIWAVGGVFSGTVSAAYFDGDGSNLTGIVVTSAAMATNVSGGYGVLSSITATDIRGATGGFATKVSAAAAEFSGAVSGTSAVFSGIVSASEIDSPTGSFSTNVSATDYTGSGATLTGTVQANAVQVSTEVSATTFQGGSISLTGNVTATEGTYSGTVSAAYFWGDGSNLSNITATAVSAQIATNVSGGYGVLTSITAVDIRGATGGFTTKVSSVAGEFSGAVSGVSAVFSGDVSVDNLYADTNIYIGGAEIPSAGALTSINNVTTSINTVLAATSSALATSIGNSNSAITSINTVIANVSSALATSIGNSNSAITSINTVIANVSSALATSIGNSNTNITTNVNAISSINTVVANVSSALATSIGNHLPLAGGTLTGTVSGTDVYVSAIAIGVNSLLGKNLHIETAAVADLVSLTDGANISVDFNAGQNLHVTLEGNRTLDNPTNCVAGQVGSIFILQDGTGSRTLSYGTSWEFPAGTAPTLSTSVNAADRLDYIVRTSTAVQSILSKEYS